MDAFEGADSKDDFGKGKYSSNEIGLFNTFLFFFGVAYLHAHADVLKKVYDVYE